MANLLDTFTGSAGLLTAHTADSGDTWGPTGATAISLDGSGYAYTNATETWYGHPQYSSWTPPSADYSVRITIGSDGAGGQVGPGARLSGSDGAVNGYLVGAASGALYLFRYNTGTPTTLISAGSFSPSFAPGDVLELQVIGTYPVVLNVLLNGVNIGTYSDSSGSSITSTGSAGFMAGGGDMTATPHMVTSIAAGAIPATPKPASGTPLDSGNSLHAHLVASGSHVWAMLEGSGSTTSDSSGNGNTLTIGSGASWSTNGDGPTIACDATGSSPITLTTLADYTGSASYSVAFRAIKAGPGAIDTICGSNDAQHYLYFYPENSFTFHTTGGSSYPFTSDLAFTSLSDYLLVIDQPASRVHLYVNGAEISGSPLTYDGSAWELSFDRLGSGYSGATAAFGGSFEYFYVLNGYAASAADAVKLHTNPYSIFATSTPSTASGAAMLLTA